MIKRKRQVKDYKDNKTKKTVRTKITKITKITRIIGKRKKIGEKKVFAFRKDKKKRKGKENGGEFSSHL